MVASPYLRALHAISSSPLGQTAGSNSMLCVFSVRFALKSTIHDFSLFPHITHYNQISIPGRHITSLHETDLTSTAQRNTADHHSLCSAHRCVNSHGKYYTIIIIYITVSSSTQIYVFIYQQVTASDWCHKVFFIWLVIATLNVKEGNE
jgi:hypothetical protein